MTTPFSAQPTFAEINDRADRAAAQLGEHKASYAAAREANAAASYATTDPATQAAVGNIGKNSTKTSIAAGAIWGLGYALLPQPVRKWYALATAAIIGGFLTTDLDAWNGAGERVHDVTQPYGGFSPIWEGGWKLFIGVPTIWSWLLWAFAAFCIYKWVTVARQVRRWHLAQQQAPEPVAPLPETFVEDMNVPEPPFTAQVVETPRQAPPVTHRLWIPEPQRRVRRGGTTLSGVPIKDRRAVDPRTL